MCDYSLHHVQSRPAKVGDKLVTTRFDNSLSRGFSAQGAPNVAVCLLPGTEVAFDRKVEHDAPFPLLPTRRAGTTARFMQINTEQPSVHHDALEFSDGQVVLLTRLVPGQRATVLQLPVDPNVQRHIHPELANRDHGVVEPETTTGVRDTAREFEPIP